MILCHSSRHNRTAIPWAKNSLDYYNPVGIAETFNQINWTNATIKEFESAVNKAEHYQWCLPQNRVSIILNLIIYNYIFFFGRLLILGPIFSLIACQQWIVHMKLLISVLTINLNHVVRDWGVCHQHQELLRLVEYFFSLQHYSQ